MTDFSIQAKLAEDREFLSRAAACIAGKNHPNPLTWAYEHAWQLAVYPGLSSGVLNKGDIQLAISDEKIEEAVTAILAASAQEETE